ncbi:MAG: metal-sulfur cluster assembly factor [Candidatus Omnitrophica bacterium]|nr:metal-sulfur cluster assembly factor [Candidatus Omnitrophota bacterium]
MKLKYFRVFLWILAFLAIGYTVIYWLPRSRLPYPPVNNQTVPVSSGLSEAAIRKELETVVDPELGLNIVEMGLIRTIDIDQDHSVTVKMLFTSPFCPFNSYLRDQVRNIVRRFSQATTVTVVVDREEKWDISMMTESARKSLQGQAR